MARCKTQDDHVWMPESHVTVFKCIKCKKTEESVDNT